MAAVARKSVARGKYTCIMRSICGSAVKVADIIYFIYSLLHPIAAGLVLRVRVTITKEKK